MKVIHGLDALSGPVRNTAVAIGVFDGVHRGHQEILRQTVREARSLDCLPLALTFDIHPAELFAPDKAPPYIASLRQRARLIEAYGGGIEAVVIVRFDRAFASLSPDAFVSGVLKGNLGARHVLVGADFCYGKGRAGNVTTLLQSGAENDFAVTVVPPILLDSVRISSTQVRGLIAAGDVPAAVRLLGHPFVVEGRVARGKQLGRALGFPTANLEPTQHQQLLPGDGVYAALAILPEGGEARAAVSVGTNPTTDRDGRRKVEAYLLDGFDGDLYEQPLALDFRLKIREQRTFESVDALRARMARDVERVVGLLPSPGP